MDEAQEETCVKMTMQRDLYIGGQFVPPASGTYAPTYNPGTGRAICDVAQAGPADVEAAVDTAKRAQTDWGNTPALERGRILRALAALVRDHAQELAALDAENCGNPVSELLYDANAAAAQLDYFGGLVTEIKGQTIPVGPGQLNYSVRQPLGVVARILAFNHPFMFFAGKIAAPLAAGNAVIVKPPDQAPLSALRLAELFGSILPAGVLGVLPGGRDVGAALASHPAIAKVGLIGSQDAGRAVLRAASDTIKPVLLELGGKNAFIAFPDMDPDEIAEGLIRGMNFGWCGQSCGSTSRAFIHEAIYDRVVESLGKHVARFRPGLPTDPKTTMGALISEAHRDRVLRYIETAKLEGARLLYGGGVPTDPELAGGYYVEPTIFADVNADMTIAREEIFGPVLAVLRWSDEDALLREVNATSYGLTCAIWTNDLAKAHRTAMAVEAGFVWINEVGKHFIGAPFGGVKQSGLGREECLGELLSFTEEKNIHVRLR